MANIQPPGTSKMNRCHMCYTFYVENIEAPLTVEYVAKIQQICSKYLFAELIGASEWTWIPSNDLPFCIDCYHYIQHISKFHGQLEEIQRQISDLVDVFALKVLKCRKSVMEKSDSKNVNNEDGSEIQKEVPLHDFAPDHEDSDIVISNKSGTCEDERHNDNDVVELDCDEVKILSIPVSVTTIDEEVKSEGTPVNEPSGSAVRHQEAHYLDPNEHIQENRPTQLLKRTIPNLDNGFPKLEIKLDKLQFGKNGCNVLSGKSAQVSIPMETNTPTKKSTRIRNSRNYICTTLAHGKRPIISNIRPPEQSKASEDDAIPAPSSSRANTCKKPAGVCTSSKWKCRFCKKSFPFQGRLKKHNMKCSSSENRLVLPYECKVCGKAFEKEYLLKSHIRQQKSCAQSGYGHHQPAHNNVGGSPTLFSYPIGTPKKVFKCEANLKTVVHSDYRCTICGILFKGPRALVMHLKTHPMLCEKVCRLCTKLFPTVTTLNKHLRTHVIKESNKLGGKNCNKSNPSSSTIAAN